ISPDRQHTQHQTVSFAPLPAIPLDWKTFRKRTPPRANSHSLTRCREDGLEDAAASRSLSAMNAPTAPPFDRAARSSG
ncbi:MAG: hypothetical protein OXE50_01315, partial [Chloroflexi bacterium]|nr:hypothetical protein [Chloroflexota bacterium]